MLTFNLKKEWFEKIKSGEKTHEYRKQTKYWIQRFKSYFVGEILEKVFDRALSNSCEFSIDFEKQFGIYDFYFACGYPSKNDKDKWLRARALKFSANVDGNMSDLKINEPVFDIEFELI